MIADLHESFPRETTPIGTRLDVEFIAARVEASRPFATHVCGRCGATGTEPCRTASGKVLRRFHVARG